MVISCVGVCHCYALHGSHLEKNTHLKLTNVIIVKDDVNVSILGLF